MRVKTVPNKNNPKSLTTEERLFLDKLISKLGEKYTLCKRVEVEKAAQAISGKKFCPTWISRNPKARITNKRGRYDLSALLKLPVVAFKNDKLVKKSKKLDEVLEAKPKKIKKVVKTVDVVEKPTLRSEFADLVILDEPYEDENDVTAKPFEEI